MSYCPKENMDNPSCGFSIRAEKGITRRALESDLQGVCFFARESSAYLLVFT